MTQPVDGTDAPTSGTGVDARDVIDELVAHIGRLSQEMAILRVQLKNTKRPTVVETQQ